MLINPWISKPKRNNWVWHNNYTFRTYILRTHKRQWLCTRVDPPKDSSINFIKTTHGAFNGHLRSSFWIASWKHWINFVLTIHRTLLTFPLPYFWVDCTASPSSWSGRPSEWTKQPFHPIVPRVVANERCFCGCSRYCDDKRQWPKEATATVHEKWRYALCDEIPTTTTLILQDLI